jgi:DNA-binding XRE family transcriptional regulator
MIKSDRQLKYTKNKLEEFKADLKEIQKKYSADKDKAALLCQGYKEHVAQLRKEIAEYEFMKEAPLPVFLPARTAEEISRQLVRLRLAKGLTQAQLASRMKCTQSDISRLEREDYDAYSIPLLRRAAKVLEVNLELRFVLPEKEAGKGRKGSLPPALPGK